LRGDQSVDGRYFLKIYSEEYLIKVSDDEQVKADEQARTEAQKVLDSMGDLHEDVTLYYIRVVTKFPAKPFKQEPRGPKELPLYYDNL